jgi:hypothetical protein
MGVGVGCRRGSLIKNLSGHKLFLELDGGRGWDVLCINVLF